MEQLQRIKNILTPSQLFFMIIMIPIISLGPIIWQCCNTFIKYRQLERPDYENGQWSDYLIVMYTVPVMTVIRYIIKRYSEDYFHTKLKQKYSGEQLKLKTHKATRSFYKIFYFAFITGFGLYVFSDTPYHTPAMFGSGNIMYLDSDWPYNKLPRYLKLYYMVNMSYHVEDTLHHLFQPAQNDFFEMLLHHYITVMLVIGSYMINFWNSGINVMIQMDNGDAFVSFIRSFMDIWPVTLPFIAYLCAVFSWIYFRIYLFAYEVIWKGSLVGRWRFDHNANHQNAMQILLIGLLILNIYWTLLFLRMGFRLLRKGEVKDIQNNLDDRKKYPSKVAIKT